MMVGGLIYGWTLDGQLYVCMCMYICVLYGEIIDDGRMDAR